MKILQSMFFLLTHIQVNMLFITGLMCKQIFKCKTIIIYAVIKTKKYFNLSLNIKFFQSVHLLICSLFVCNSMETPHSPVQVPPMIGFAFLQLACVYLLHTAVTSSTSLVWRHILITAATANAYILLLILSILGLTEK